MTHSVSEKAPLHPSRKPATLAARVRAVTAMGIVFPNPLGLAAGFDRTGELLPSLLSRGFGHVEVGTITPATGHAGALRRNTGPMRLGLNIGSDRLGLDERVVADYVSMLEWASTVGDYVVANLTVRGSRRDGNTAGIESLVRRLAVTRDVCEAMRGRRVPLLLKIDAGDRHLAFPAAVMAARLHGLDGILLVSDCLDRIRAVSEYLDGSVVISVGGVRTTGDVRARLAAGASLVQVHRAFSDGGPARIRRILRDLAAGS